METHLKYGLDHQFRAKERFYARMKETEEEYLLMLMIEGVVKTGSSTWRAFMGSIHFFEDMAIKERDRYEDNN